MCSNAFDTRCGPLPPDGSPEVGPGLRNSGSVDVHIALEVDLDTFENRNQRLDVIVSRLSRSGQREIALKKDLSLGKYVTHQAVRVRNRSDVVHRYCSGS